MNRHCFLAVRNNTLLKQAIKSLLEDLTNNLKVIESQAANLEELVEEVAAANPDIILLEESSPLTHDSWMTCLLIAQPGLPVIVISEDNNLMHIVHRETIWLSSSAQLIKAINFA